MDTKTPASTPSPFWSIFTCKCPRCRIGPLFKDPNPYNLKMTMQMPDSCPICGQKYELQTGFYFGTGYVSYAITFLLSAITFVIWFFTIGVSIHDNRIFWWLGANAVLLVLLQPIIQRLSRSMWIAFFVRYDPDWQKKIH